MALSWFQVKELVATDDFKPNCALVVLDFLIRHSFIEPDSGWSSALPPLLTSTIQSIESLASVG